MITSLLLESTIALLSVVIWDVLCTASYRINHRNAHAIIQYTATHIWLEWNKQREKKWYRICMSLMVSEAVRSLLLTFAWITMLCVSEVAFYILYGMFSVLIGYFRANSNKIPWLAFYSRHSSFTGYEICVTALALYMIAYIYSETLFIATINTIERFFLAFGIVFCQLIILGISRYLLWWKTTELFNEDNWRSKIK